MTAIFYFLENYFVFRRYFENPCGIFSVHTACNWAGPCNKKQHRIIREILNLMSKVWKPKTSLNKKIVQTNNQESPVNQYFISTRNCTCTRNRRDTHNERCQARACFFSKLYLFNIWLFSFCSFCRGESLLLLVCYLPHLYNAIHALI